MVDRRTFLFGLPLLGFLKPRPPTRQSPLEIVESSGESKVLHEFTQEEWERVYDRVSVYYEDGGTSWYAASTPTGLQQTGIMTVRGRFLVNPDA